MSTDTCTPSPSEDPIGSPAPRVICMLPTYNEAENIAPLIRALLAIGPHLAVLVMDDSSPDGTPGIAEDLERNEYLGRIHVVRRPPPRGRGLAGAEGFARSLELGAETIVEMDADLSHDPNDLPRLLAAAAEADVVVGSRLVEGGGEEGRSPARTLVTLAANCYIRTLLGVEIADCTSGYRVFSRRAMEAINPATLTAEGPWTVEEVLGRAARAGLEIREVPIGFRERAAGESKLNVTMLLRTLWHVTKMAFRRTPR